MRGTGRVVFAAFMLLLVGTVNIIYGIGALDDANVFVNDKRFVLDNLNTLGWVLIILGAVQLTGGFQTARALQEVSFQLGGLIIDQSREELLQAVPLRTGQGSRHGA